MSLEQTIGNLEIRYANVVTFVGSSNTMVDTTTGRIQTKGIQHNSNVITDVSGPHGRVAPTLKKYPEIAFGASKLDRNDTTNTYVQAGYTVMASSYAAAQEPYRAFDYSGAGGGSVTWTTASITNLYGNGSGLYGTVRTSNLGLDTGGTATPQGGTRENGEWITLQIPNKITLSSITISRVDSDTTAGPKDFQLYGSNDGTTWVQILSETGADPSTTGTSYTPTSTPVAYTYFGLVVTRTISRTDYMTINDLVFYGTEENPPAGDTSVDTTFTSIMNTPQTTGANVYVDAKLSSDFTNQVTGPTPVGTAAVHDNTNKYWELNGQLTSNVTLEANTFLEGDQPHAVSVWFNSSNLEANVSNTCVFSVSDQEHLNSQNLDLQSNTWHNLTYAYQGEGGSKVTYLDGRKVAEDQVEDTFGEYPPFAMTGYSQGGYVLSVDADHDGTNKIWKAFDGDDSPSSVWFSQPGSLDADSSYQAGYARGNAGQSVTDTDGTTHSGSWGKIEFPYKFVLNYVRVHGGTPIPSYWVHNPDNYVILGSNDDTNWDLLTTRTGANNGSSGMTTGGTNIDQHTVNATKAYKYIKFLVTKLGSTSGDREFIIASLKFYGHRENDLVRLPDPTNVLKYPHIAMTGPAQRGYVASSSVEENAIYAPWKVFNGNSNTGTGSGSDSWVSKSDAFTNGISNSNYGFDFGSGKVNGPWLRLDIPHKLKMNYVDVYRRDGGGYDQYPKSGYIYGYDGSTWHLLKTFTNITQPSVLNATTIPIDSNIPVSSIVMLITERYDGTSTTNQFVIIKQIELYGTGVDSVPIQIGGGNIDKVANFRVYDKFVGEDQALEIWDAQKDEFGRAKSSMTLHKGRLGLGATEPEGRLAVLDEPHNLEEFPPRAMSDYKTYFEGHGVFCASASNVVSTTYTSYKAFNKNSTATAGNWWSQSDSGGQPEYSTSTGEFSSTDSLYSTNVEGANKYGQWLQIEFPYKINYKYSDIQGPYHAVGRQPHTGYIVGSNDLTGIWTSLHRFTDVTRTHAFESVIYTPHTVSTQTFKYFRLVIEKMGGGSAHGGISRWDIFGTREQGQSVLHDGQLTLTKNLTVPSIGPSVTNTRHVVPKRHKLVLEFDTSTNPTDLTTVNDTSEMGNDGTMRGNAYYSIGDNAFTGFPSSASNYINGHLSGVSGAYAHTQSYWINGADTTPRCPFTVGVETGNYSFLNIWLTTSKWVLNSDGAASGEWAETIYNNRWYHVVLTYDGGTSTGSYKLYIDGEYKTPTTAISITTSLALPSNPEYRIGRNNTTEWYNGMVSSPKVYSVALTAGDVKKLYDMGRGDSYHVTNFQNTLVGINLGNGRAPRSALDVRDQIYARTTTIGTFTGQHICFPDESMEKGLIVSAKKNKFVKLNGLATGKSAITIDESLPIVSLSNVAQDKACFGVVSAMEESNAAYRTEITGGLVSESVKIVGDNRAIVNSVGEGAIWVVNTGGSLESGDYITTSNVAGYGQKQDGAGLMNYTVAKITMDCDFTASNVAVQTIKREETGTRIITEDAWNQLVDYDRSSNTETQYSNTLVSSDYSGQSGYVPREVTTIMDYTDGSNTISVEEWSNLESNIQNTYQSNTFTEIVDYTKFVSFSEWSNLTAETQNTYSEAEITTYYQIQRGENVLDENGQLQFEDKTGATEAPYERRFLDVSGAQTDEANAVHIAAFVGCTYHCG